MPGNAPAGHRQPCAGVPGSEVSLCKVLEHRLLQLGLRQQFLEPGVLLLQLGQAPGLLGLHAPVLLPPAVVRRLRHLDHAADLDDGLALGDQLLGSFELADDLLRCVPGAFHGRVPGPVWPAEDSHSPWTDCRGPRHFTRRSGAYPTNTSDRPGTPGQTTDSVLATALWAAAGGWKGASSCHGAEGAPAGRLNPLAACAPQETAQEHRSAGAGCGRCLRSRIGSEKQGMHSGFELSEPLVLFPQLLGFLLDVVDGSPVEHRQQAPPGRQGGDPFRPAHLAGVCRTGRGCHRRSS